MFTKIDERLSVGQSLTIEIYKTAENMTVSVLPKDKGVKDDAISKIKPILLTGTAEELDEGFIQAVSSPLQKATGLLQNLREFEKGVDNAEQNSKAGKEKAEKINKLIAAAEKLESEKKLPEAIAKYNEVLEIDPEHAKAKNKATDLEAQSKQGSLF